MTTKRHLFLYGYKFTLFLVVFTHSHIKIIFFSLHKSTIQIKFITRDYIHPLYVYAIIAHSLLSNKNRLISANANCSRIHFKEEMYTTSSSSSSQTDRFIPIYLHVKESSNSKRSLFLLLRTNSFGKKTTRFHIIIFSQQQKKNKFKDLLFRVVLYLFFFMFMQHVFKIYESRMICTWTFLCASITQNHKEDPHTHTHTHMIRTQCVQLYSNLLTKCPVFVCVSQTIVVFFFSLLYKYTRCPRRHGRCRYPTHLFCDFFFWIYTALSFLIRSESKFNWKYLLIFLVVVNRFQCLVVMMPKSRPNH